MIDLFSQLSEKAAVSPKLRAILKRVKSGSADFNDTSQYSGIYSDMLGEVFSQKITDIDLSEREEACISLLRGSYDEMNDILGQVQTSLDSRIGVNIKSQQAAFPAERVTQFAHSLIDPTVDDEVIKRRAGSGGANVSRSFHDDYIEENAKFRNDAGLKCYITRTTNGETCKWCADVAGKYLFGSQPSDIFRRHDNCDCSIIYDNKVLRGKQNADGSRSKTWEEIGEVPADYQPTVLSEAEARTVEQRNLAQIRGLTQNQNYIISAKHSSNAYSVNRELVNSKVYHDKFEDITPHKATNENIYQQAKRLLEFRDGSENESLIVLDSRTGKLIVDNFENSDIKLKTGLTNEQYSYVTKHNGRFVILHNHPGSTRPSGTDILTLWREEKADCSIVAGHDGTVFLISEMDRKISLDKIYYDEYNKCIDMQFPRDFAAAKATDKLYETNAFVYKKR